MTPCSRFGQQYVHITERAFHEAALAVAQIELPHAHEAVVETELPHGGEVSEETFAPMSKCGRVVRPDVFEVRHLEVCRFGCGCGNGSDRRDEAAGEDEALD